MASNDKKNFINYTDFDKEKLSIEDGKEKKRYGFRMYKIKYAHSAKENEFLRLRSPVLFSFGIKKCEENGSGYFMTLKSFYDEKNPKEKEIKFKETLNSISKFLWEELSEYSEIIKEDDLKEMEFLVAQKIFFPSLRQYKPREEEEKKRKKGKGIEITTDFYEKVENGKIERMENRLALYEENCEVIVYLDIQDIFVKKNCVPKIRSFISAVIVTKRDVSPPLNYKKPEGIKLESDDKD